MGRPTLYSEDLAVEIAAQSTEGFSLKTICASEAMPDIRTVVRWRHTHPEFDMMLMRAHNDKADIYFEDLIDISDEQVTDAAQAARQRTRVQARQWACARLNPNRYGDRIVNAHILPADKEKPFHEMDNRERLNVARRAAYMLHLGARAAQELREKEAALVESS